MISVLWYCIVLCFQLSYHSKGWFIIWGGAKILIFFFYFLWLWFSKPPKISAPLVNQLYGSDLISVEIFLIGSVFFSTPQNGVFCYFRTSPLVFEVEWWNLQNVFLNPKENFLWDQNFYLGSQNFSKTFPKFWNFSFFELGPFKLWYS